MSAPQKGAKPASRWNFLQQAVASVESRLDTILGDEEDESKKSAVQATSTKENPPSQRASGEISRASSSAANDRLQERLAKAMAKKNAGRSDSPSVGSEPVSRTSTPFQSTEPGESSEGKVENLIVDKSNIELEEPTNPSDHAQIVLITPDGDEEVKSEEKSKEDLDTADVSVLGVSSPVIASSGQDSLRTSTDGLQDNQLSPSLRQSTDSQGKQDGKILQLEIDHESAQSKMQEELNGYIERIDALQAKLQYLTKEAADSAKQAAASAQDGSAEKKLLEKDEKIALLMQEGQNLSKMEMKHLTTIKKLRSQAVTTSKDQDAVKARAEKAERALRVMEDRARKAEAASKRAEQDLASNSSASRELDAVTRERNALNNTIADMKAQLARATSRAEAAESKAQAEQLEKEKKKTAEMEEELSTAKIERELSEEKLRREIKDLKASLEREKELSRAMETEMIGEQAALETKLESFRARAEEASTGDQGDAQAKLLRQIETLQSQYAAASQNWQGIEGSLLGRIANVEKERDDVVSKEADIRKKLREASSRAKTAQRELDEFQSKYAEFEKNQADAEGEIQRSLRKIEQLEEDLAGAKKDLANQKVQAETELNRRLEEEKARWATTLQVQRTESPSASVRKASGLAFDQSVPNSAVFASPSSYAVSRKSSFLHGHDYPMPPPRQQSTTSIGQLINGGHPGTPPIITSIEQDDFFDESATPGTRSQTASPRGLNDLISTSTIGAGPSVQLVERMSANVRRLESDKAASKEELARITAQRDEARKEVVTLMRDAEEKAKLDERLKALEEEHTGLNQRYQTTLELLGEKSEQVEELKADIIDVKQMYRQLADTMK